MDKGRTEHQIIDELVTLRQRVAELERILIISKDLGSGLLLKPLLRKIVVTAAELTDSEGASILLLDTRTGELRFRVSNESEDELLDIPVPLEGSIAGTIFTSRQPLIVSNVQGDPRHYKDIDRQIGCETRSVLGVPLQIGDRCIGVLETMNKQGNREFGQDDLDTLVALAAHAAVAIENARLYQEVKDHAERLEERVRERTAELQARNEELDAYAHTVAHDLKNPLALVIGYAEMLAMSYADVINQDGMQCLRKIARGGHRMTRIIDELLLLAELREVDAQLEPLDMTSVVTEALERLILMIEEHKAEIIMPDTWPAAMGYGPWVEEVWANYISNAIKYGGQPPRIELGATEQADGVVRFWVRDNGAGLSPEEQAQLFTRFARLDQECAKGHGLGLSIVHRIVGKLGGQVGVESASISGEGSVFFFTLPGMQH